MSDYDGDDLTAALELLEETRKFMREHEISCEEIIYQCDWVIENAYEFIAKLCGIVGYPEDEDEE